MTIRIGVACLCLLGLASPLGISIVHAVVPPGATPAPACTGTGAVAFPKRIAVCGSTFPRWDGALVFPNLGRSGYGVVGFADTNDSSLGSLLQLDQAGTTLRRTVALQEGTSIFPTGSPDIVLGYHDSFSPTEIVFGRYNSATNYTPLFQHKLTIDDTDLSVTTTPDERFVVLEDRNEIIQVTIFEPSGALQWAKRFSSAAFGIPGGSSFTESQLVSLEALADNSFLLVVSKRSINVSTLEIVHTSVVVKLSSMGVVEWAKTVTGAKDLTSSVQQIGTAFYFASVVENFTNPNAVPQSALLKLSSTGAVAWSKVITGSRLGLVGGLPNDKLLLSGFEFSSDGTDAATELAVISGAGTLDAQTSYSFGLTNFTYPAIKGSQIWLAAISANTANGPFVDAGQAHIGLTDASLSSFQWMRYKKDGNVAFVSPASGSNEVACSFFDTATGTLEVVTMNDNFTANSTCELFVSATATTSNPGLTIGDLAASVSDVVVTAATFTPMIAAGNLTFEAMTVNETALCESGGGGGGGGGGATFALSQSTANVSQFPSTGSVGVTASQPSGAWTAVPSQSWLTITSGSSGTGNGTVNYSAAANVSSSPRSATITVGTAVLTVTQSAMSGLIDILPSGAPTDLGGAAGSGSILVLAQIAWTGNSESWITLSSTPPAGAAPSAVPGAVGVSTIYWSVTNGSPLNNRNGTITFKNAAGDTLQSLVISQTASPGSAPVNMAVRTQVGTGDNIVIPGFVIAGAGKTRVLIRGVGPTLGAFGVQGTLSDPQILLFKGGAQIGANDSWASASTPLQPLFGELGAFSLSSGVDAAELFDLEAGPYTVHLKGSDGGTGIGLVELYVVDPAVGKGLVNLAARAEVGAGDRVMIPGFVIGGSQSVKVLVRGVGPTLGNFGVPDVLEDPIIEVFNAGGTAIANNDDWGTAPNLAELSASFVTTGAFALPANSKDAALLLTLTPGTYTAHIKGKGTAIGVALIEVYFLAP